MRKEIFVDGRFDYVLSVKRERKVKLYIPCPTLIVRSGLLLEDLLCL